MPAVLRPRWIRQVEGISPIINDDGSPAQLPAWTAARRGHSLACSEGPLLDAEAADLMWRNYTVRAPMGKPDGPSKTLLQFSLVASNGRATPAALLLMQPLRTPLAVVQAVETRPSPEDARRDMIAYLGKGGHACLAWQETYWPLAPGNADNRKLSAKLALTVGPGARRKVDSPYRLDALPNTAVAEAIAHFIVEHRAPGHSMAGGDGRWCRHRAVGIFNGPASGHVGHASGRGSPSRHACQNGPTRVGR
ncbi:hypothetical protein AAFM46_08940 [Arthrobacter sp. TMP15]|uniref:hypothetical protein n=1 Tax=Arthrobacter sp. TMP15 TaxID=3140789 RepID=UPI0031BA1FF0